MKNFIFETIPAAILVLILAGVIDFSYQTIDGVYEFSFIRYGFCIIFVFFILLLVEAMHWFENKSKQKKQKQILQIKTEQIKQKSKTNIELATQKISYKLPWQYTLRMGFRLFILAPLMFLILLLVFLLPAFNIFLIDTLPKQSTDQPWIGILLLGIAAPVALVFWLQKLALFLYTAYHAYKKGFFLYADSQGLECCLFPAIAWRYVQFVSLDNTSYTSKGMTVTDYGISVTLDAIWIQQHPIPSWWSYIKLMRNKTKLRHAQNILYFPCNPLGKNTQIAADELSALHQKYTPHAKKWPPKLIELLTEYGLSNPKAWLEKEVDDMQKELNRLNSKKNLTESDQHRLEWCLEELDDLLAPYNGKYAQDLIKNEKYYRLLFKNNNLMDRLNSISNPMERPSNQENSTPEQIAQQDDLEQKTLDIIEEIQATHDQIAQEVKNIQSN